MRSARFDCAVAADSSCWIVAASFLRALIRVTWSSGGLCVS